MSTTKVKKVYIVFELNNDQFSAWEVNKIFRWAKAARIYLEDRLKEQPNNFKLEEWTIE